jgi:hypothetical protein
VTIQIRSLQLKARLQSKVRKVLAKTMDKMVSVALDALSTVADAKLQLMAQTYKAELAEAISATPTGLQISLSGVGKDLEVGYPARDMKPDLLASSEAKTGKDGGRYVDVPFEHSTESGRYNGMPAEIKSRVQAAVKRGALRVTKQFAGEVHQQKRYDDRGKTKTVKVERKTSIYSDMFRTSRRIGKKVASSYQTIRRVSSRSPSRSWWHPGFGGIHALKEVEGKLKEKMRELFKIEMTRSGIKTK